MLAVMTERSEEEHYISIEHTSARVLILRGGDGFICTHNVVRYGAFVRLLIGPRK